MNGRSMGAVSLRVPGDQALQQELHLQAQVHERRVRSLLHLRQPGTEAEIGPSACAETGRTALVTRCPCNCHSLAARKAMGLKKHKNCAGCRKALKEEAHWLQRREREMIIRGR